MFKRLFIRKEKLDIRDLERHAAMKISVTDLDSPLCPYCKKMFYMLNQPYCPNCGQFLDWDDFNAAKQKKHIGY